MQEVVLAEETAGAEATDKRTWSLGNGRKLSMAAVQEGRWDVSSVDNLDFILM